MLKKYLFFADSNIIKELSVMLNLSNCHSMGTDKWRRIHAFYINSVNCHVYMYDSARHDMMYKGSVNM